MCSHRVHFKCSGCELSGSCFGDVGFDSIDAPSTGREVRLLSLLTLFFDGFLGAGCHRDNVLCGLFEWDAEFPAELCTPENFCPGPVPVFRQRIIYGELVFASIERPNECFFRCGRKIKEPGSVGKAPNQFRGQGGDGIARGDKQGLILGDRRNDVEGLTELSLGFSDQGSL